MKSVDKNNYNLDYFDGLNSIDYRNPIHLESFGHIYKKIGNMLDFKTTDQVIDFGCGSGHLSLYLFLKYKCFVTGIDYSEDAIFLCRENLMKIFNQRKNLGISRINFLQLSNDKLPIFNNIKAIFLVDVIEHLYDEEIKVILNKFTRQNKNESVYLLVHTDNNTYLKFIRPIVDIIAILTKKSSIQAITKRNTWEKERHINLTTAKKLSKKLKSFGFVIEKIEYSDLNFNNLKLQLGRLGEVKIILKMIYCMAKYSKFLFPSFYMIAKYDNQD